MAWYKPWRVDDEAEKDAKNQARRDAEAFSIQLSRRAMTTETTEGTRLLRARTRGRVFGSRGAGGLRAGGTILTGLLGLLGAASMRRTLGGAA